MEVAKECREAHNTARSVPAAWHTQNFPSSPTSWSKWVKYPRILYLYSVYIYSGEWFGCCNVRKQKESVTLLNGGELFWARGVGWGVSDAARAFRVRGSKALPWTDIQSMVYASNQSQILHVLWQQNVQAFGRPWAGKIPWPTWRWRYQKFWCHANNNLNKGWSR